MKIVLQKWIIMDKAREVIAVGTPRNRYLVGVNDGNPKRIMTYTTEAKAKSAFKVSGFFVDVRGADEWKRWDEYELEAVPVTVTFAVGAK